ncbi:MAG: hypothetical protein ACTTKY_00335 [Catonella sp.]
MREDLKKIIEDNWEDIQALIIEKAEAELKPKSIWDLDVKDRDKYYCLYSHGYISSNIFEGISGECTRDMGNAFLTREEAEFERERRKVEAVMKKYSRPFKDEEDNYYMVYDIRHNSIEFGVNFCICNGLPYFESKEIAEKVIDEIGEDRLKKYWFGVE